MKKWPAKKKLILHKETLADMESPQFLELVKGGCPPTMSGPYFCMECVCSDIC